VEVSNLLLGVVDLFKIFKLRVVALAAKKLVCVRCTMSAQSSSHCRSCQSVNQSTFNGEIAIHFPGIEGLNKPIVWVFPKVLVCLNCGFTEFAIPEKELDVLVRNSSEDDATDLVERTTPENGSHSA